MTDMDKTPTTRLPGPQVTGVPLPRPAPAGPTAAVPPPAAAQAAPPRRRKRRLLLPLLAVVAIGIVGNAVTEDDPPPPRAPDTEVPEPTHLSVLELQPGDCYNAAPLPTDGTETPISSVDAVPCTDPHTAQVVAELGYAGQDYTEVVETRAEADCTREAQARLRPELLADPAYRFGQIHPTAESWPTSSSIVCVVATDTPTTGSSLL